MTSYRPWTPLISFFVHWRHTLDTENTPLNIFGRELLQLLRYSIREISEMQQDNSRTRTFLQISKNSFHVCNKCFPIYRQGFFNEIHASKGKPQVCVCFLSIFRRYQNMCVCVSSKLIDSTNWVNVREKVCNAYWSIDQNKSHYFWQFNLHVSLFLKVFHVLIEHFNIFHFPEQSKIY
jgi:hypothetical protein